MKGFLLLGCAESNYHQSEGTFDQELHLKDIKFCKQYPETDLFKDLVVYQFLENDSAVSEIGTYLVSGEIYGTLLEENSYKLGLKEVERLLQSVNFKNEFSLIDGNAAICGIFKDRIVFQNDLETQKKIFYYKDDLVLCISTDLQLLLKAVEKDWTLRKGSFLNFIIGREAKWPYTFISDVYVLPPLSRGPIDAKGLEISSKRFSDFLEVNPIDELKLKSILLRRYNELKNRRKNKKIAVALSGGYDSNSLIKLYKGSEEFDFTAVSAGYKAERKRDDNIFDETVYAERIADRLNIPFKRYYFSKEDYFRFFSDFVDAIDQPGLDPSSNFLLNKHLKMDGFDLLVSGMGGDVHYANRRYFDLARSIWSISRYLPSKAIDIMAKNFSYRGPFGYFNNFSLQDRRPKSFLDLFERYYGFNSLAVNYLKYSALKEVDSDRDSRQPFFDSFFENAKTAHETYFSLIAFSKPDFYHASLMAERTGLDILMPFIDSEATLMLMNGSKFNKVHNREFEMNLFGGIEKDLLASKKSGFSIPYSEWLESYSKEIFEFYLDNGSLLNLDFDLEKFRREYIINEGFSSSRDANVILWKLLLVKRYVEKNNLHF